MPRSVKEIQDKARREAEQKTGQENKQDESTLFGKLVNVISDIGSTVSGLIEELSQSDDKDSSRPKK
jgi:hypothetical protein